jgi:hypothetical protein
MKTFCFQTILHFALGICSLPAIFGQDIITLTNPSFEWDSPGSGRCPRGWIDLSEKNESPVDIQPGSFGVRQEAKDGDYYVGMVTRDNGTWEGIGQKLTESPLRKDSVYTFSIWLMRSPEYRSLSRTTTREVNYQEPVVLNIIGYNTVTKQEQILGQSAPITDIYWKKFEFTLRPVVSDFDEIDLVAYYADEQNKANGHILIDNCSPIKKISSIDQPSSKDSLVVTLGKMERNIDKTDTPMANEQARGTADSIFLHNPSFEKDRRATIKTPTGWFYMGTCKTCRPTIEPGEGSRLKPNNNSGKNYISLSVYSNGESECIGQRLSNTLRKNNRYQFSVRTARDARFTGSDGMRDRIPFTEISVLRVLGINSQTEESEVLAQTVPIDHLFWYRYNFTLSPKAGDYDTLALEVWYVPSATTTYNGHVLVDDCSPVVRIRQ